MVFFPASFLCSVRFYESKCSSSFQAVYILGSVFFEPPVGQSKSPPPTLCRNELEIYCWTHCRSNQCTLTFCVHMARSQWVVKKRWDSWSSIHSRSVFIRVSYMLSGTPRNEEGWESCHHWQWGATELERNKCVKTEQSLFFAFPSWTHIFIPPTVFCTINETSVHKCTCICTWAKAHERRLRGDVIRRVIGGPAKGCDT
jgi:hypothetical protein